jgi:hypothetical protein
VQFFDGSIIKFNLHCICRWAVRYWLQQYIILMPRKINDKVWWNRHYLLLDKNMRIISNTIDGFSEKGV